MRELDKQEPNSSDNMRPSYFDHPAIDSLERYVLNRCSDDELELVETHMFACSSCLSAIESLEIETAAVKLALQRSQAEAAREPREARKSAFWKGWFSIPTLSWAGAGLAACALALFAFVPTNVSLNADRDLSTITVPEWRNVHVTIAHGELPDGQIQVEIANASGTVIWSGKAQAAEGKATVHLPRMMQAGSYFARIYMPGAEHSLLNEFRLEVKFQL